MLDNIIVFNSRRPRVKKNEGIYFSIGKNKADYLSIKFFVSSDLAKEVGIDENSRLTFGCSRDNNKTWYLIVGDSGCAVRADKKRETFFSTMNFPFNYIDKKMQNVDRENIKMHIVEKVIELNVNAIFKEELVLK